MYERHTALAKADDMFRIVDGEQFSIFPNPAVPLRESFLVQGFAERVVIVANIESSVVAVDTSDGA
jgi:hypothetical protein